MCNETCGGVDVMSNQVAFLHRYVAPFMAGAFMAGATVAPMVALAVVLCLAGAFFAYVSLPAGGRMMTRVAGLAE